MGKLAAFLAIMTVCTEHAMSHEPASHVLYKGGQHRQAARQPSHRRKIFCIFQISRQVQSPLLVSKYTTKHNLGAKFEHERARTKKWFVMETF